MELSKGYGMYLCNLIVMTSRLHKGLYVVFIVMIMVK